jgi:hypothetical protein
MNQLGAIGVLTLLSALADFLLKPSALQRSAAREAKASIKFTGETA